MDSLQLNLDGLAQYINDKCKSIVFLTGAGVSVGAGIPDFRSPGGMYDTLQPDLLTATSSERELMKSDPTAVVSWKIFKDNQLPYLELRRPFILGLAERKWQATIAHFFVQLCHDKGVLRRLFTQNIDGLDFQTSIPHDKIITVHGTMGKVVCEFCSHECKLEDFLTSIRTNIKDIYKLDTTAPTESKEILCASCNRPGLKPATVLYGRSLPKSFSSAISDDFPHNVDLLIVAGTSLTVGPANQLVLYVSPACPRLLVNKEKVGAELGIIFGAHSERDIFCSGNCDNVFLELIQKLGWVEDLRKYADKLAPASRALLDKI